MSEDTIEDNSKHGHAYDFPNTIGQDRHIQNIIEHATNLFPQLDYSFHRFGSAHGSNREGDGGLSPSDDNPDDDRGLDSFGEPKYNFEEQLVATLLISFIDLHVLGRTRRPSQLHHRSDTHLDANHVPIHEGHSSRMTLPLGNPLSRPSRVLGDASHHFRPYIQRDLEYRPPFARNPIHVDRLLPTPANKPICDSDRDGSHRAKELQSSSQLVTPSFYQRRFTVGT